MTTYLIKFNEKALFPKGMRLPSEDPELERLSQACDQAGAGIEEAIAYAEAIARRCDPSNFRPGFDVVGSQRRMMEDSVRKNAENIRKCMERHGCSLAAALIPPGIRNVYVSVPCSESGTVTA